MYSVDVNLAQKSYVIHISCDNYVHLKDFIDVKPGTKALVVSDENVYPLYSKDVGIGLKESGYDVFWSIIPAGEGSKNINMAQQLYTDALKSGLNRSSTIIALGGGVVGDLAGYVASTYMRGVDFIQLPTSLLSQVDSSIGGKVAINHPLAKNIIGTFHQPKMVYINVNTLSTLPKREFSTGMAELIKHGFIYDREFLLWLYDNMNEIVSINPSIISKAIHRSCQIKAQVVEQDEFERGLRAILNFGHTIGHAIEASSGFSQYTHGEAVALGMVYESKLALSMGLIDDKYMNLLTDILSLVNLPTTLGDLDINLLIENMTYDKKNTDGNIVFVLPKEIGKVDVYKNIEIDLIRSIF